MTLPGRQQRYGWPWAVADPTADASDRQDDVLHLIPWTGPWDDDDPDANFKAEVASHSLAEPMGTLRNLAANLDIPVGALARSILAKWASGGAEGLLELGPPTVQRMRNAVRDAELQGTAEARLVAYEQLRTMLEWLGHGLDEPATTYPQGGSVRPDDEGGAVSE